MILADTSVWVDHFRVGDNELRKQLLNQNIVMHPWIVAELALGSLPNRVRTIAFLEQLPVLPLARIDEVRQMIEARRLYARGIGVIDAHLIASTLLNPPTRLWTRDKRLADIAKTLGIHSNLP
jgi:predicted nucleic acid-binding protein